jgi:DNA polymerase (family 10)
MHTTRTDGRDSIDDMVAGAKARGHQYVAITEHSKAIAMAFGFDAARVRQSVAEIEEARRRHPGIHILHGLEVDILADGELDLDDETLALLDWVIVSIHSRFEQSPEVATARALRAVSHPLVHAFGHPTGRAIGSRDPVPFDVERVCEAAAEHGVAMEINAAPARLDLSDVNARLAKSKGCRFVIDTDAHAVAQLDLLQFGVFQARRAGLTADDVWNTLPYGKFRDGLLERRGRGAARNSDKHAAPKPTAAAKAVPAAKAASKAAPKPTRKVVPGLAKTVARAKKRPAKG